VTLPDAAKPLMRPVIDTETLRGKAFILTYGKESFSLYYYWLYHVDVLISQCNVLSGIRAARR
jgi:hypothetical protein